MVSLLVPLVWLVLFIGGAMVSLLVPLVWLVLFAGGGGGGIVVLELTFAGLDGGTVALVPLVELVPFC